MCTDTYYTSKYKTPILKLNKAKSARNLNARRAEAKVKNNKNKKNNGNSRSQSFRDTMRTRTNVYNGGAFNIAIDYRPRSDNYNRSRV